MKFKQLRAVSDFLGEEDGTTAVEYAVMIGSILIVCLAAFAFLSAQTNQSFESSSSAISGATN